MTASARAMEMIHPGLRRFVVEADWKSLSAIQEKAIPAILSGHDCVIQAPTAGGKTEAVLFPTLTRAARARPSGVQVLYLAPLRALLNNLEGRGERYANLCGLESFKWHGDVSQAAKIGRLRAPPQLLLTTPESVEAILLRKAGWQQFFSSLEVIIIDEAHNFAGGDRGGHLACLLERLQGACASRPQRIAVSATVGNPGAVLEWLAGAGRPHGLHISVGGDRPMRDYQVRLFEELKDTDEMPPNQRSRRRLISTLESLVTTANAGDAKTSKAIVFAGSRRGAEDLSKDLCPPGCELRIRTHHSAIAKFFREEAEQLIQVASEDGIHAIISTSTLELGIDIGELGLIVQCGGLASSSSFLQRVGRTGRRAGRPQRFRGLCIEADALVLLAGTVSLGLRGEAEALLLPRRAFHLMAHQFLCLALQEHGISRDEAWQFFSRAHCFSSVTRSEMDILAEHMVAHEYLREVDGLLLVGMKGEASYLGSSWRRLFAVFDTAPMYEVYDGKAQVGTLDAAFVDALPVPFLFVLGARRWKAHRVDPKSRAVHARRAPDGEAPKWVSFGGPDVPYETAQEVGRLLHTGECPSFLDDEAKDAFETAIARVRELPWSAGTVVAIARPSGRADIHTYAGDRRNRALARLFTARGVAKATANYRRVELEVPPKDAAWLSELIATTFAELRSDAFDEDGLLRLLAAQRQGWPFSPFSACLPNELLSLALAERTMDAAGLLDTLRSGQPSIFNSAIDAG